MKKLRKYIKGYTIIETVIYIALFSVLSLAFTQTMVVIMKSYTEVVSNREVADSAGLIMERIAREIRQGEDVDGASVYHATDSDVTIHGEDELGNARTFRIRKNGTDIELSENGTLLGDLNPTTISVTAFSASLVTTTQGKGIKFSFTINTNQGVVVTKTFYNTIMLRGAY